MIKFPKLRYIGLLLIPFLSAGCSTLSTCNSSHTVQKQCTRSVCPNYRAIKNYEGYYQVCSGALIETYSCPQVVCDRHDCLYGGDYPDCQEKSF